MFNLNCSKIFLKTCYENGLKKVIFSSTAAVYGNPKAQKVTETDPTDPLNPYASSKLELENLSHATILQNCKEEAKNRQRRNIIY